MLRAAPARKLVVTATESNRQPKQRLSHALLALFRRRGLAMAVVYRGIPSVSEGAPIRTTSFLDPSIDLPVRVEVIDTPEAIDAIMPEVRAIAEHAVVEVQETTIVQETGGSAIYDEREGR